MRHPRELRGVVQHGVVGEHSHPIASSAQPQALPATPPLVRMAICASVTRACLSSALRLTPRHPLRAWCCARQTWGSGGGICAYSDVADVVVHGMATVLCDGCIVEGNEATYHGGGMFTNNGEIRLIRSVVRNNKAYGRDYKITNPAPAGQNIMIASGAVMYILPAMPGYWVPNVRRRVSIRRPLGLTRHARLPVPPACSPKGRWIELALRRATAESTARAAVRSVSPARRHATRALTRWARWARKVQT